MVVFKGTGAGIGPAANAVFWDKEYIAVDNWPDSPFFGRIYVTATEFVNGIQGSYVKSPIFLKYSDDGGLTWSRAIEVSGTHESCSWQETGPAGVCDEDQFSYPIVGRDGTVYVQFHNYQNAAAWEEGDLFDAQIMVVRSEDGGETWSDPVPVAQLEDGYQDMPFSVIRRQTIWGHQLRWNASGNIAVDPTDPDHLAVVFADRGAPNPNATPFCFLTPTGGLNIGTAPDYDPCGAGPGSDTDVFVVESTDGGETWGDRVAISPGEGIHEWFPWADFTPDGTLVVAWDRDVAEAPADAFAHVLWDGSGLDVLGPDEQLDVSVTHWAGQYVPQERWPAACGPAGYTEDVVGATEGKDCNVFHGDYTGLDVGPDGTIHVTWTGLSRLVTSPQVDFYTLAPHDGYAQDAMYAQR
ncbi:MAG: hypothetical protein KatS3mg014_1765 [Actinomycetota bacterium]|nr:MAG: hypothetical protein KatS3mg014_1765 [Actinomycetota bacterium]